MRTPPRGWERFEESDPNYNESLFLRAVDEFFLGREAGRGKGI